MRLRAHETARELRVGVAISVPVFVVVVVVALAGAGICIAREKNKLTGKTGEGCKRSQKTNMLHCTRGRSAYWNGAPTSGIEELGGERPRRKQQSQEAHRCTHVDSHVLGRFFTHEHASLTVAARIRSHNHPVIRSRHKHLRCTDCGGDAGEGTEKERGGTRGRG
jgi:hypothetical protein